MDAFYDLISRHVLLIWLVTFPTLWLFIGAVLSRASRWSALAEAYPDRPDVDLVSIGFVLGHMDDVRFDNILKLTATRSGLRVRISRLFGPFWRPFLVPWRAISVSRSVRWNAPIAQLSFGVPPIGSLDIPGNVANKLARAVGVDWPEQEPLEDEPPVDIARRWFMYWAVAVAVATAFFAIAHVLIPDPDAVIWDSLIVPAVLISVVALIGYLRDLR